ncbi:hypothetical protein ACQPW1_24705 [Nocardia sp. CA-128927]|uniref:hypothetical protein n=1 Tax=Nocardia sp. CA-128927 TaxID=3239975 RepID=UPI003D96C7E0
MADTARNDPRVVRQLAQDLDRYLREAESGERTGGFAQRKVELEITQEVGQRRRTLRQAEQAYAACCRIEDADCSGPKRELDRAVRALDAARRAQRMYTQATVEYTAACARFAQVRVSLTLESKQLLHDIAHDLDRYNRASSAAGAVYTGSAPSRPSGTGGTSGTGGAAGVQTDNPPLVTPVGFPAGFALVPLSSIDTSGSTVTGPESFKSDASPTDLEWGLEAFNSVIVNALRLGKGIDYFRERDAIEKRYGARSYADTYTWFFGEQEALQVGRRADGTFEVHNGYHRIWVARRMGLTDIPARVVQA